MTDTDTTRSSIIAEIYIDSTLDSMHFLPYVDQTHRCSNPHGHTFSVRLFATGSVAPLQGDDPSPSDPRTGMVRDYDDILVVWQPLHEQLDHVDLNRVPGLENPTCENLAIWILERTPAWITAVEIGTGLVGGMRAGCRVNRYFAMTSGVLRTVQPADQLAVGSRSARRAGDQRVETR